MAFTIIFSILIHILSFLPMKQDASTSTLSKRWRTLFAFTHNLDFEDPFVKDKVVWDNWRMNWEDQWDNWRKSRKIFRDFVYRTLNLQAGSHVDKFSLTLKNGRDRSIKHWVRYALKHGVSEFHLCLRREMPCLSRIFTSTTLVKLSLGSSLYIEFPSDTSLPSLKVLLLDEVIFRCNQLSDVFLAACPVLEDLKIHYGDYPDYSHPVYLFQGISWILSSKTIKNLYYSGKPLFTYFQLDLVVKATLDLRFNYMGPVKQMVEKLISGIRNVKTLHLTISAVEVISVYCKDELPVFNNLIDLVFSSNKQGWKVLLPRLLECSPNLKVLVLSGLHCYTFEGDSQFVGIQVPLENQIEKLSIKQYQGSANELRHIGHLLLNMERLKVVKVYVASTMDEPEKMKLIKDLMKLPTASSELKIQVI